MILIGDIDTLAKFDLIYDMLLCKEIEEDSRMGRSRDLFKKIRDTKGTCHAKMGTIKDRYGIDLTEAEDIKEEVARIHRTVQKRSSQPR